jgi:hypothetical protein
MAKKRTDIHRKGAIVPGAYDYLLTYDLPDGGPGSFSYGVNCALDRRTFDAAGHIADEGRHNADGLCCVVGILHVAKLKKAEHGSTGSCTACGAWHRHGDVWKHRETGEAIFLGYDCAAKYAGLVDRTEFDLGRERAERSAATYLQRVVNDAARAAAYAEYPELEADFETGKAAMHNIILDIFGRFTRDAGKVSPKQVALVHKIAEEIRNPAPAEAHVDAPEGRQVVEGLVVGRKYHDSDYGPTLKLTVKIETPGGSWLVWLTAPAAIAYDVERGDTVRLTATLTRSDRDRHFAFGKRPSKATIVRSATPQPPAPEAVSV